MSKWLEDLTTGAAMKDFMTYMQKKEKAEWVSSLRPFGQIRKVVGKPLPMPFPANTYSSGVELLTLEIIDGLLQTTTICPALCANAWAKTSHLPTNRDLAKYQLALSQLEAADVPIGPLTSALQGLLPAMDAKVDTIYKAKYLPAMIQRPQLLPLAKTMAAEQAKQKTLLEGKLKDKPFSFYQDLVLEDPAGGPDLHAEAFAIRVGSAGKSYAQYCKGVCAAGMIVEKGTKGISGDKFFKFKGITSQQMFDALKGTGWNMKNLKKKEDLEKVG